MTMKAFNSDISVKCRYLDRVRAHAAADEIIHGKYWQDGKGCAVGCTIHGRNHMAYERELGIPVMLARLEDRLFEGQSNGKSKAFPERFLLAARVGADLSRVGWKFLYWLLTEELVNLDAPRVSRQIKRCADVLIPLTKGEPMDRAETQAAALDAALEARNAAYAAADAADAAAADAAYAAYAAADAADAAAYADAADAAADARSACYERMAEKLLQLMAECEGEPLRVAMGAVA